MVERIVVGPLFTNSYLFFIGKKECCIIDPGANSDAIIRQITLLNKIPKIIVFTHGHLDHTGAALDLLMHYGEVGIRTVAHEKELPLFGKHAEKYHLESFRRLGPDGESVFIELFRGLPEINLMATSPLTQPLEAVVFTYPVRQVAPRQWLQADPFLWAA